MSNAWKVWLASALMSSSFAGFAQGVAQAPAAGAQTFVCKDGTSVSAASSKGACTGHKGIDKAATAKQAEPAAPAPAAAAPAAAAPAAKTSKAPPKPASATAPGGGPDKVWANENTKVYHCQGDRYYGTTKNGEYMSEADAKAKGMHAAKGSKACAA